MDTNSNHDVRISSNQNFGIVFFVVFLLIAFYPITNSEDIRVWSLNNFFYLYNFRAIKF